MLTIGKCLGTGARAAVFEVVDEPRRVVKRTACPITIPLLRGLIGAPQVGLPAVFKELGEDDTGGVWFEMERLYDVVWEDAQFTAVRQAIEESGCLSARWPSQEGARELARALIQRGQQRLARGAEYLAQFLAQCGIAGMLDLNTAANLMTDAQGRIVFSDPVSID